MSHKKTKTDPSVHTLAPITILANYDRPKVSNCKTELNDFVHAKFKSQQNGEFSSIITNGSTAPLVRPRPGDEEIGYEPFEHRKLVHPTSNMDTLIHLLKGSLGSGILAMPMAFLNAGLVFGVVATITIGFICTYCVHMLVTSAHMLYRRARVPAMDYADVAETAFAMGPEPYRKYRRLAKALVNLFLTVDLYGCCCVYIVFVAGNLQQIIEYHTSHKMPIQVYMAGLLVPLILMNLIRNLKWMAPMSMLANVLMATGIGITFYYIFSSEPVEKDLAHVANYSQWPLFFGTAIFALEGIGVVMPLENNMKTPQDLIGCPSVLNFGMSVVVLLYTTVGYFGYHQYGSDTKANITLNLPIEEMLSQSVKLMIAIAILFTYSLQFYVPMGIIWRNCQQWFPHWGLRMEYCVRVILIILSVAIACAFPKLGPFISLVGAVCLSMLGLIFPAIIETVTTCESPGWGRFNWRLWKNILLMAFGIIGFITGSWSSIVDIMAVQAEHAANHNATIIGGGH